MMKNILWFADYKVRHGVPCLFIGKHDQRPADMEHKSILPVFMLLAKQIAAAHKEGERLGLTADLFPYSP